MGEEEELGGTKATAEILNFVDRNNEERILSEIEEIYPELAEEVRNLMFTFEDVIKIDDRSVQTILKEVPRDQLATGSLLRRTPEAVSNTCTCFGSGVR